MADIKISALTAVTTIAPGTDVLPLVSYNGGATLTTFKATAQQTTNAALLAPGPIGTGTPAAANFTTIGATTQGTGSFTSLTATGAITHNTTTNNQSYTTSGAGTITITSGTAGSINNFNIGATTAGTGKFTTLTATGAITANTTTNNQSYTTTGAGTITISSGTAGSIDNMVIGGTTPLAVTGTNVVATLGLYAKAAFTGTYTDGVVVDYASPNGRISVGSADTLTFYTGGVANTAMAVMTSTGINSTAIGATTASTGAFTTLTATTSAGYATGAGGTVTQLISRTTGVTINKICGQITLFSAAGSATPATFTVTNSTVAATDTIIVNQASGTDAYAVYVTGVSASSFKLTVVDLTGTTAEAPVLNFSVIKSVNA